ncbi:MAG: hypothetical protein A2W91_13135 [Bacteroidetes bacterium GWF2_38_335]|nr:MAG: hypothetical protein A2W91_13135 [Bacteroidetes bacterium GWF2_38_335]OFY77199.1 MAG: hypothetical protein A2281_14800 [Bacteroidetes bacterium RIFOXYA12_FULL_38_20]HBS85800.1 hypothetical protein [Bacteroidales bacterium]
MKKRMFFILAVAWVSVLTVSAQDKPKTDEYPTQIGHLKFNTNQLMMQNINLTDSKTDTLKMLNEWNSPITISFPGLPEHITCKSVPESLNPNQKGYILVTYNAAKRNDFGYVYDRLIIKTNDSLQPDKTISISANIVEDFSKMTPKQLKDAPKIQFENLVYDFGTINQGDKIEYDFVFSNTGKNDLIIRKTKGSCGCTVGTPEKSTLKSGEKTKLHVTFNSAGKSGQQSKTITVTCNDPTNSNAVITIKGNVNVAAKPVPQEQPIKQ